MTAAATARTIGTDGLREIERRVLLLAMSMVYHANTVRETPSGIEVVVLQGPRLPAAVQPRARRLPLWAPTSMVDAQEVFG